MTTNRPVLGSWSGIPRAFVITAAVCTALLAVVESQTPFDVRVTPVGGDGLMFETIHLEGAVRSAVALTSLLLMAAPFLALRSTLLGVAAVLPRLAAGALSELAWPWSAYAALLAVAVCSSWRRPRTAWGVAILATALPVGAITSGAKMMTPGGSVEFGSVMQKTDVDLAITSGLYVVATVVVMLVTLLLRREADRSLDLFELVRRRREVAREAVVLDERSRLARDLHDVVAHHISLIAVRAETAPYTYPDLSSDARLVLSGIADDSRSALDELRRVLGVLRRSDGQPDRTPQPVAADIGALVLEAQSATDVVSASLQGLEGVQAPAGYVAYRVVQEALTNARRHAPGVPVDVIAHGDGAGGIRVLVSNRAADPGDIEPGGGLTGMTERVAAVGGELDAEIRSGEFVVEARIPATLPIGAESP